MRFQLETVSYIVLLRRGTPANAETLRSLTRQSYRNFEIIVIVDDIDSAMQALLEPFRHAIQFVARQVGATRGRMLNDAVRMARGSYISIITAGTVLAERSVETRVSWLEKNRCDIGVCTDCAIVDKQGVLEPSFFARYNLAGSQPVDSLGFYPEQQQAFILQYFLALFPFTLFRRDVCLLSGPFNEDDNAFPELQLCLKMLVPGGKLACINTVMGKSFFDGYKILFHAQDIVTRRAEFLCALLESGDDATDAIKPVAARCLRQEYRRWIEYLLKQRQATQAKHILTECVRQFGIDGRWLWQALRAYVCPQPEKSELALHDFWRLERLQPDLLRLKYAF